MGFAWIGGLERWCNGRKPLARAAWLDQPGGVGAMAADAVADQTELAEFGILGPLEVSRCGCLVPLGGPRQRAVLALLLLEPITGGSRWTGWPRTSGGGHPARGVGHHRARLRLGPLLSCQSADEPGTSNWAGFCDPHVDALASQARAAQLTDPAAARRLWAQADRIVTDQAPYVPVLNSTDAGFVSSRVGNYQESPVYSSLLDQMWVR